MDAFCEQCHNLVSGVYKTSCKTGEGVEEMFRDIAKQLSDSNRCENISSLFIAKDYRRFGRNVIKSTSVQVTL